MNDSVKVAKLWVELGEIKNKLDNEMIPVGSYLSIDNPELMIAMENLSEAIGSHFEKFRLKNEAVLKKAG
jgi:hypothetical protein